MICSVCGLSTGYTADAQEICAHHAAGLGDNWSDGNRIMCDFIHRRKIPPRLAEPERDEDFWAQVEAGTADAGF